MRLVVLTGLVHIAGFALVWPFLMDDALITYRYARNVAAGFGPIWNGPGAALPAVEGFSSFLHMFTLAGLNAGTGVDLEVLGKLLGLAGVLVTIGAIALEVRRSRTSVVATWVALSPFLLPPMVMTSASGMETGLFLPFAWLTPIAAARLLDEHATRAVVARFVGFGLLGTLIRPEFALSVLGLCLLVAYRRPPLRRSLATTMFWLFVVPGMAVTGWRLATYADLVPNSFYVKQRLPGFAGAQYVGRFLLVCCIPYLLLIGPQARRLWAERRDLVLVVAVCLGLPLFYFLSVRPSMGWWYRFLIPHLPILAWLASAAVSGLPVKDGRRRFAGLQRAALPVLVVMGLAQVPPIITSVSGNSLNDDRMAELGRRLRPFASPTRWLSYYDVGRLPYASDWNVVDVIGLTTHRRDLRGDCGNGTDLILRSLTSQASQPEDIPTPCPSRYELLVELLWFADPERSRRMRIFVRSDVSDKAELAGAILADWPEPYLQPTGWPGAYTRAVGAVFGP
jgi:hypothetical protein